MRKNPPALGSVGFGLNRSPDELPIAHSPTVAPEVLPIVPTLSDAWLPPVLLGDGVVPPSLAGSVREPIAEWCSSPGPRRLRPEAASQVVQLGSRTTKVIPGVVRLALDEVSASRGQRKDSSC